MNKNDIIELEITSLTNECFGVGKADGMVIFVPFSAIGDKLRVRIVKNKKTYCYGRIEEILTPSPDRITPDCPLYGKCGGCSLRHISYNAELKAKERFVRDSFERIGGLDVDILPIVANDNQHGYRNKLQMPIGQGKDGGIVSGFYATHSHRIVPCDSCLLQPELFKEIVAAVKAEVVLLGIAPYNEETKKGILRHIYIRKGHYSGETCLCLVATKNDKRFRAVADKLIQRFDEIKSVVLNINRKDTNVILCEEEILLYGTAEITDTMCGNKISIAPKAFYQVNTPAAEKLYSIAKEFAQPEGKVVLDLYCGAGTIGLSMAKEAKQLIGVEIIPEAIENAKKNAKANNIENAEFICADADKAVKILLDKGLTPDVVIVDPPRKGCGEEAVEYIAKFGAERIVMVSCNSATAARDCAYFRKYMYKAEKVVPVDMFSRTGHCETIVLLSKLNAKQHIDIELNLDELDLTSAESKATYDEIKAYVKEHSGLNVSSLYISQTKRKYGIIERENYNKPKSENTRQPKCPIEKEKAIVEALRHFKMI